MVEDDKCNTSSSAAPIWLIERELGALRKNVEQELVIGLREKLQSIFLQAVKDCVGAEAADAGRPPTVPTVTFADTEVSEAPGDSLRKAALPFSPEVEQVNKPCNDFSSPHQVPDDTELGGSLPTHLLEEDSSKAPPNSSGKNAAFMKSPRSPASTKTPKTEGSTANCPDEQEEDEAYESEYTSSRNNGVKSWVSTGTWDALSSAAGTFSRFTGSDVSAKQAKRRTSLEAVGEFIRQESNSVVAQIVRSDFFDYGMSLVLILNSIVLGLRVDWNASNLGEQDPAYFVWTDRLFCIIFLSELSLRIYTFKLHFYTMSGWQWAYFDTIIVMIQCFEEILLMAEGSEGMNIGFLKMLKMGRLLRMVRMVRLLPELKNLVCLILASMSSFVWTCVLLLLLTYMLAVYLTIMAVDVLSDKIDEPETLTRTELKEMWGSVGSSVLSIYWSITGGQDWADVIGPLNDETGNQIHNIVFCMFIAFATMVLMNLVTGVFVEGAARLAKEDRDKELSKMAHKVFRLVDDDCSEELSREEFNKHLEMGHMDNYLSAVELARSDAADLFDFLDVNHSGAISVDEFVDGCLRLRGLPRAADLSQVLMETRKHASMAKKWFGAISQLQEKTCREFQTMKAAQLARGSPRLVGSVHEV